MRSVIKRFTLAAAVGGTLLGFTIPIVASSNSAGAAVQHYTIRAGNTITIPSQGPIAQFATAQCNPGETATGGGGRLLSATSLQDAYHTFTAHSHPLPETPGAQPTGWYTGWTNMGGDVGQSVTAQTYVVCFQ